MVYTLIVNHKLNGKSQKEFLNIRSLLSTGSLVISGSENRVLSKKLLPLRENNYVFIGQDRLKNKAVLVTNGIKMIGSKNVLGRSIFKLEVI